MPSRPAVVVALAVGLAAGVGGYAFVHARGASGLTDDPGARADCQNHDVGERACRRGHRESAGADRLLRDDVNPGLGTRCRRDEFREVWEGSRARACAATPGSLAEDPPCADEPGGAAWTSTSS